jgi:tRNA A-37 threonylcarbamoyl transferase component Bud32
MKLIQQGAEAKIFLEEKKNQIIKDRIAKSYRIPELDNKIRKQRTKAETKILEKASKIIDSPVPKRTNEEYKIIMPYIQGKKLSENLDNFSIEKQKEIMKIIGESIANLHKNDIIHGDLTTSNMILVENEKRIYVKKNFKEKIKLLKNMNFPQNEYAIFGSAILEVMGIRKSKDLDVIVKQSLWKKLQKDYKVKKRGAKGRKVQFIKIGCIEIFDEWPWINDLNKAINDSEIIEDVPFVKIEYVLEWKQKHNRKKDKKDVEEINKYLEQKKKVFFIDFGLSFISKKIEDKAVDFIY